MSANGPRWLVPNCSSKPSAAPDRVDLLLNNAGVMAPPRRETADANARMESRLAMSRRRSSKSAVGASARMRASAASPRLASRQARIVWAPERPSASAAW